MNKVPAERLAIAVAQLNPIVGDVSGNLERARIARAEAARDGADIVGKRLGKDEPLVEEIPLLLGCNRHSRVVVDNVR